MNIESGTNALKNCIVDDGSGEAYKRHIFQPLEDQEGVALLRHERNLGKGQALKTAFSCIRSRNPWQGMAVATADADGQHSVEDVCAAGQNALEDIIPAICSYQIQMHWVFREEDGHGAG